MEMRGLIIFLCLIVCALVYTGCAEKQITKSEGDTATQNKPAIIQNEQTSAAREIAPRKNGSEQTMRAKASKQISSELKDIHFDFDSYVIRPEYRQFLLSYADYLLKNKNVRVVIEGNCDERGNAGYNLALGSKRAQAAKRFLVNSGVNPKRIKTISYGMEHPIDLAHNEEAWAKNRRGHFVVQ